MPNYPEQSAVRSRCPLIICGYDGIVIAGQKPATNSIGLTAVQWSRTSPYHGANVVLT